MFYTQLQNKNSCSPPPLLTLFAHPFRRWISVHLVISWKRKSWRMPQQCPQYSPSRALSCAVFIVVIVVSWRTGGGEVTAQCFASQLVSMSRRMRPPPSRPSLIKLLSQHFVTSLWRNATDRPIIAAFCVTAGSVVRPGTLVWPDRFCVGRQNQGVHRELTFPRPA